MSYRRFSDCSVSERLLYTLFIGLLSTGYAFAMVLIFISVAPEDGKPSISAADISLKYYGNRSGTRLEQALTGTMKPNRTHEEYLVLAKWIHDSSPEARYTTEVKPILDEKCIFCHNSYSGMPIPDLTTYENVKSLVKIDTGESMGSLVKVSHIHLFGLGMVFYLLGRIFVLTDIPVLLKRVVVVTPFAAIALDIGSWWFTKFSPHFFAWTVLLSGAAMGFSFAFQAAVSVYQMWFLKDHRERRSESGGEYRRRGEG
jgi:hypothetical protein